MIKKESEMGFTRRQFIGASAAAGFAGLGFSPENWISIGEADGLQSALDALPEQGGVIHIPAGTYNFNKTVTKKLLEGQHLAITGDGRGSIQNLVR